MLTTLNVLWDAVSVTRTKRAARSRRRKKRAVKSRLAAPAGHRGQERPRRSVKPHPRSPSAEPDVRRKVGRQEPSPGEVQAWWAQTRLFKETNPLGRSTARFAPPWVPSG